MRPVVGHDPVVADIVRILGIDPARCKNLTLSFKPGAAVIASFELMPSHEQLAAIKAKLEPVAERIEKREISEELFQKLLKAFHEKPPGCWNEPPTEEQVKELAAKFEAEMSTSRNRVMTLPNGYKITSTGYYNPSDEDPDEENGCDTPVEVETK